MKSTVQINPPITERIVTITISESDARILRKLVALTTGNQLSSLYDGLDKCCGVLDGSDGRGQWYTRLGDSCELTWDPNA